MFVFINFNPNNFILMIESKKEDSTIFFNKHKYKYIHLIFPSAKWNISGQAEAHTSTLGLLTDWLTHWFTDSSVRIMLLETWKGWKNTLAKPLQGFRQLVIVIGITVPTWGEKKIRTWSLVEAKLEQFNYGFICHPQV